MKSLGSDNGRETIKMHKLSEKFMQKLNIGKVEKPVWENIVKLLLKYQDILEYDKEIEGRVKVVQHEIKINKRWN